METEIMLNDFLKKHEDAGADIWQDMIEDYKAERMEFVEYGAHIEKGMIEYLKTIGETEDFTLTFDTPLDGVELDCKGDLFNLEQIGDFCDTFNLKLIINNRLVVENHLKDETVISTRYLFQILKKGDEDEA